MQMFKSTQLARKSISGLAMAIALTTGAAIVATAALPETAQAQRDKKERKKKDSGDDQFSDEFRAAYATISDGLKATGNDTGYRAEMDALAAMSKTNEEKNSAGGLIYNAGARSGDEELLYLGSKLFLESGMLPPEQLPQVTFTAYQLAVSFEENENARRYLQQIIDLGQPVSGNTIESLQLRMAESYWDEERYAEGFDYLSGVMKALKDSGGTVDSRWHLRAITVAYQNETPQLYDLIRSWLIDYPTEANWRDAVNRARNLNDFDDPQLLDLLRLSRRVGALREANDYLFYIDAADARKLPQEIIEVIGEGRSSGILDGTDPYVSETLVVAKNRAKADVTALPELERDASKATADLIDVTAAGDAFLSYDEFAKSESFYRKALEMPGVKRDEVLTRLGIALGEQGKVEEASEIFSQVAGPRAIIAKYWDTYFKIESADEASASVDMAAAQ